MALLPVLDDVEVAPPLFVCVIPVVLEFDADELPLVTFDVAVPVFEDELVLPALPPLFVAELPVVSSSPPVTFPPFAAALALCVVLLEPVTYADELFLPELERRTGPSTRSPTGSTSSSPSCSPKRWPSRRSLPASVNAELSSDVLFAVAEDELSWEPVTSDVFDASEEPDVTLALAVPVLSDVESFVASPPVLAGGVVRGVVSAAVDVATVGVAVRILVGPVRTVDARVGRVVAGVRQ